MNTITERQSIHNSISSTLACRSNKQLEQLIADGEAMHTGIGGTSLKIELNNTPIFVKKVPITDFELQPDNYRSTANIFNLPMCYQYGIGSAGFGAWRELAAHIMTTNWVITNRCPNFPILYHWRILKDNNKKTISNEEQAALNKDTAYWENNQAIKLRLKNKALATHYICLFLEFIPSHLYDWLGQQLIGDNNSAISAVALVDKQTQETYKFMSEQNFIHMDAHFENILTDGEQLYYSDFGLAISNQFNLSLEEQDFFKANINYDRASYPVNLLHCLITHFHQNKLLQKTKFVQDTSDNILIFNKDVDQFKDLLSCYLNKSVKSHIDSLDELILNHAPIAIKMDEFYRKIQKDKSTKYPSDSLNAFLNSVFGI